MNPEKTEKEQTIEEMADDHCEYAPDHADKSQIRLDYMAGATDYKALYEKKAQEMERVWKERLITEVSKLLEPSESITLLMQDTELRKAARTEYIEQIKTKYNIE